MKDDYTYTADEVANAWGVWLGKENQWYVSMKELAKFGCSIVWYGGYPRSASAIPLCFVIILPDGKKFEGNSRLKDIKNCIKLLTK